MTFHENGICPQNLRLATDIAVNFPTEIERQTYLFKMISRVKSQEELDTIVANLLNHPDQVPSLPGDAQTNESSRLADGSENSEQRASSPSSQLVTTTREARTKFFTKIGLKLSGSGVGMNTFIDLLNDATFMPIVKAPDNDQKEDEEDDEKDEAPLSKSQKRRHAKKQRAARRGKPAKGKKT